MKNIFLLTLTLLMAPALCIAQSENEQELIREKNYIEVEPIMPKSESQVVDRYAMYPGGQTGIYNLMIRNLRYPKDALNDSIQGRVKVQYVVEPDGSVNEIEVINSVHPSLDKEAVRIINLMEQWLPAMRDGKAVRIAYRQDFSFKLN